DFAQTDAMLSPCALPSDALTSLYYVVVEAARIQQPSAFHPPAQHNCEDNIISYISPEERVPQDHPLRSLRVMTDEALQQLQPRFNNLYAKIGRPSIAPEKLRLPAA